MNQKYSEFEKIEAVKLAKEIGAKKAAKRLNLNRQTLYNWMAQYKDESKTNVLDLTPEEMIARIAELEEANKSLQNELLQKETDIEILEGAVSFFSRRLKS